MSDNPTEALVMMKDLSEEQKEYNRQLEIAAAKERERRDPEAAFDEYGSQYSGPNQAVIPDTVTLQEDFEDQGEFDHGTKMGGNDPDPQIKTSESSLDGQQTPTVASSAGGGNTQVSVEGVDSSEERCQPSSRSETEKFPYADESSKYIWAFPPVMSEKFDDSGNISINDSWPLTSDYLYTIFENSFPILTLTPVRIFRPENSQTVNNVSEIGPRYKFVVKNEGNINYSISNEFGPSMIEDGLKQYMQADTISELWQFLYTSRNTQNVAGELERMINSTGVTKNLREIGLGLKTEIDKAYKSAGKFAQGNGISQTIFNLADAALDGIFRGKKIDIPNIWKGSSSSISQNFTVVLHCTEPDNDKAFEWKIKKPLEILLKLALPYSKSTRGESGENDIITYENPPYLKAELDGLFKSEICGITNLTVNTDLQDQTLYRGGRPFRVTVTFTIQDLYDVLLWADDKNSLPYAITGYDITDNMFEHKRDDLLNAPHEMFGYSLYPTWYVSGVVNNTSKTVNSNESFDYIHDDINWALMYADVGIMDIDQAISIALGTQTEADRYSEGWKVCGSFTINNGRYYTDAGTALAQKVLSDKQIENMTKQPVNSISLPQTEPGLGGFSF